MMIGNTETPCCDLSVGFILLPALVQERPWLASYPLFTALGENSISFLLQETLERLLIWSKVKSASS